MRFPKVCLKQLFSHSKWVWQAILSLTVKLCSKVAKIRVPKSFLPVFDTKRVFKIYDSYFDSGHVTI